MNGSGLRLVVILLKMSILACFEVIIIGKNAKGDDYGKLRTWFRSARFYS